MAAQIVARSDASFTVQVEIPYAEAMLEAEEAIQAALNDAGVVATAEALDRFDTDGTPIHVGDTKLTSKGRLTKQYQTPYGVATIRRHIYQSSRGGKTFCPLDRDARIVVSSTPRFAKMLAHEYAVFGSGRVLHDLAENHGRAVSRRLVRDVADAVALAKEGDWDVNGGARWVVERTIGWPEGLRRPRVRYDRPGVIIDAWTTLAAGAIRFRVMKYDDIKKSGTFIIYYVARACRSSGTGLCRGGGGRVGYGRGDR